MGKITDVFNGTKGLIAVTFDGTKGLMDTIFDGVRSLAMIPIDAYTKLEEKVSTKAIVYTFGFALPMAYMEVTGMIVPPGYGDLFYWITMMYFGGGAIKFVKGAFDGK